MISQMGGVTIRALDLVTAVAYAVDCVNHHVAEHHVKTAIIAGNIAHAIGIARRDLENLIMASALHDIGFFNSGERLKALDFEYKDSSHAEIGYALLASSPIFSPYADIIRNHHTPYVEMDKNVTNLLSNILFVADRIEVFLKNKVNGNAIEYRDLSNEILSLLRKYTDRHFMPEIVDAVKEVCNVEAFWFDLEGNDSSSPLRRYLGNSQLLFNWDNLYEFARIFRYILDWRSPFTVTHSSGVKAVATSIAELMGFSQVEVAMMGLAAWFHDIGKLAIPLEIINKPGPLTYDEMAIMKRHAYLTYVVLDSVDELDTVKLWAALHHEKLTGDGYPFRLTKPDLTLGSRIMAVADIFAALTEFRPYRQPMTPQKAMDIIKDMTSSGKLCRNVVDCLKRNLDLINDARLEAQKEVLNVYRGMEELICKDRPVMCKIRPYAELV